MANEVGYNVGLEHKTTGQRFGFTSAQVTQTLNEMDGGVLSIGTSEETITPVDITTAGYAYFKNLDPTNYIQVGPATTVYMLKLKPGQAAVLPLNASVFYAKANTAACKLHWALLGE